MAALLLAPAEVWGALRALLGAFGPLSLLPSKKTTKKNIHKNLYTTMAIYTYTHKKIGFHRVSIISMLDVAMHKI